MQYKINGNMLTIGHICQGKKNDALTNRGNVDSLSSGARNRMSAYLRGAVSEYRYFVTLTYPRDESTWFGFKRHFKNFVEVLRRSGYGEKQGSSVFWFLEFQERGAPHFHLFCTHRISKRFLSEHWYRIVGSGDTRHLRAGTNIKRLYGPTRDYTISYAKKYATKNEQKTVPNMFKNKKNFEKHGEKVESVGRFWGVIFCRDVMAASTRDDRTSKIGELEQLIIDIEGALNEKMALGGTRHWSWNGFDCYIFPDYADGRYFFDKIRQHANYRWLMSSASLDRIGQSRERSRQRMSHESHVMQYKAASQSVRL